MIQTGLIWHNIGTSGKLLWARQLTFGFHKIIVFGNTLVAVRLTACLEGFSSMQLVRRWICNQLLNKVLKSCNRLEVWLHIFLTSTLDVKCYENTPPPRLRERVSDGKMDSSATTLWRKTLHLSGIKPRLLSIPVCISVTVLTELYRLSSADDPRVTTV
jgi:hypothetical protein